MSDPDDPTGVESRLAVKRSNEGLKLTATLANNLAVGIFVGGLIAPSAAGRHFGPQWYIALTIAAAGLHVTDAGCSDCFDQGNDMSDFFFVALIDGSIVIAAVGVYVSLREVRALDRRFGPSPAPRAGEK